MLLKVKHSEYMHCGFMLNMDTCLDSGIHIAYLSKV